MKKIIFLIFEVALVLAFITIVAFIGINKYYKSFVKQSHYTVEFTDIDGIIVGSPVRFSGFQVGYVQKKELKNNKILLTFKITDENIELPKGSTVGIEFTGLAGSKSLEIRPPTSKQPENGQYFYPINPVRVNSLYEIQNVISESVLNLSNGILSFLNKNDQDAGKNIKKTAEYMKKKSAALEKSGEKIDKITQQTLDKTKKIKELFETSNENFNGTSEALNDFLTGEDTKNNINNIKKSMENFSASVENKEFEKKVDNLNKQIESFNTKTQSLNKKIGKIKSRELKYIDEFNESIKSVMKKMQEMADSSEEEISIKK